MYIAVRKSTRMVPKDVLRYIMRWIIGVAVILSHTPFAGASCGIFVKKFEREYAIPTHLLRAISLAESGRKIKGQVVAWPWTINAEGVPYVFQNKAEAIRKTQELLDAGISSIDVGCMQINLKHHPKAFKNLEEAFNPAQNVAYAARFLLQKMRQLGDWNQAVAHYHSSVPVYNIPYQKRVLSIQRDLTMPQRFQRAGISSKDSIFSPIPRQPLIQLRHSMRQGVQKPHGKAALHPIPRAGGIPLSINHPLLGTRKSKLHPMLGQGNIQKKNVKK